MQLLRFLTEGRQTLRENYGQSEWVNENSKHTNAISCKRGKVRVTKTSMVHVLNLIG